MKLSVGDRLPDATFTRIGPEGPETVTVGELTKGRKVVLVAVPGAFTPTCHSAHLPGFIAVMDGLKSKGVDEVVFISVNDAFVMQAWGEATGADKAGITLLADGAGEFTKALDMEFDAPPVGLHKRSKRYALMAEDGVLKIWHPEESRGCETSGGPAMLAAL